MIRAEPVPFREALEAAAVKSVLPTTGRSRDLQALESAIKRRALWMATNTIVPSLERLGSGVRAILSGDVDQATIRAELKRILEAEGYRPDPEHAGGLQDLGSTRRLNLAIETQVDTARGAGWHDQGMQPDVLAEFPAQELFRAFGPADASQQRDWAARWAKVGGEFFGTRMIALRTDPIWDRLGDPSIFPDGLGNRHPPFAFNSGMDVRDIGRTEAEVLGLIKPGEMLQPKPVDDFTADLKATTEVRDEWLRTAIEERGLGRFENGVLVFGGGS